MTQSLCAFRVADHRIAVNTDFVQEILDQPYVKTPRRAPGVLGLYNLRGQILSVIDLQNRLGMASVRSSEAPFMQLIIGNGSRRVSFVVDEVEDVFDFDDDHMQPVPHTLSSVLDTQKITGVIPYKSGLLLHLCMNRVFE